MKHLPTLRSLQYLIALHDEANFGRAASAERLNPPHKLSDSSVIEPPKNSALDAHEKASGPAADRAEQS